MHLPAGFCPDPLGELMRFPRPRSRNGGLLIRGERERKGAERRVGRREGMKWRRESLQSEVDENKHSKSAVSARRLSAAVLTVN